jgi:hypothetical protein
MAGRFDKIAFSFNGTRVYDALFIKEKVPTYFVGCSATILKVIEKKNIPVDQYFFASYSVKTGYKECSAEYKSRRLLINAEWVEANVPGFGMATPAPSATPPPKVYPPAPPILELKDHEKFTDDTGKIYEIEVRGERHVDKIWFKARDVEQMLKLDNITPTLMDAKSTYEQGSHFATFDQGHTGSSTASYQKKSGNQTALFLSYWGLVKMLFGRRHPVAIKFQRWAIEKLFTLQHGTTEAKEEMVADVLGVTPKALRAFLDTSVTTVPAIYLFQLGTVGDLRDSLNIPVDKFKDDEVVFKFGLTKDLKRRTGEHEASYGRMPGANMSLVYHAYIDSLYLSQAETDIKDFFANARWMLEHKKYKELAIVPQHLVSVSVHMAYKTMGERYAGKLQELQKMLTEARSANAQLLEHIESQKRHIDSIELSFQTQLQREEAHAQELRIQYEARIKALDELNKAYKELAAARGAQSH